VDAAIERSAAPYTVADVQRNLLRTLIDNHATVYGIGVTPGYDAALPRSLATLWAAGQPHLVDLLRLTGVDYVISGIGDPSLPTPEGLVALMDPVPGARLFRVKNTLPRVYLAGTTRVLPDRMASHAVFDPWVVAGDQAIVARSPGAPMLTGESGAADTGAGGCELESFQDTRIVAKCRASQPGVAVFLEQFDAGWSALLDDRPTSVLRVNLAMRGVFVPAGDHRIVLAYAPPGWRLGGVLSALSLLCLVVLVARGRIAGVIRA
jgi:hypothetical protein